MNVPPFPGPLFHKRRGGEGASAQARDDSLSSRRRSGERARERGFLVCLVLFLGTVLLFSRAVRCEFVDLDDPDYVTANLHVQGGLRAANVAWALTASAAGNWHPLTWLSHMLDYQWFGSDPRGHHATNILWHALNGVLAFLLLNCLLGLHPTESPAGRSRTFWICAFGAALFAWHPLRVESVAWVAERKDVLSGFFFVLTLMTYTSYVTHKTYKTYLLTLVFFAFGLMSKPMLVTVPFLLLLLDWWPLQRMRGEVSGPRGDVGQTFQSAGLPGFPARCPETPRDRWIGVLLEKVPFFMLTMASCAVTYHFQKKSGAVVGSLPMSDRVLNAVASVAAYLGKIFWPCNLAIGYPRQAHWSMIAVASAALLLLAITGVALVQRRRRPWLAVGWFWFLGMLVPVLGLVPVGWQAMADRYTYLPMLGIVLAVIGTVREWRLLNLRWFAATVAAVVIAGCAARTWNQLGSWQSSHALYEHALAVTKGNYLAHCYLGTTLFNESRWREARVHFEQAIELRPDYATAHLRLGQALEQQDRETEALAAFEAYLKINPGDADAQLRCANVLARLDRDQDALAHYETAIRLRPDFAAAERDYADSLRAVKRSTDACAHYRRALELQPDNAYAFFGLAMALEDSGYEIDALANYRRAVELKPDFADAQYNLGLLLLNHEDPAGALNHFQAAINVRTNFAAAVVGRGLAEAQLNQTQVLRTWGWLIAGQQDVAGIDISPDELARFLQGFAAAANRQSLSYDSEKIFPDLRKLARVRSAKVMRAIELKNESASQSFFAQLKTNRNVRELTGGMYYEITRPGDGPFPELQQTVNVHYTARLIDGTEFGQSGPLDLVFVTNRSVCPGWTDALQKLKKGGELKLYLPPPLPEEEALRWGIEPGSARVFEIELLDLRNTSPEDLANSLLPSAPEPEPPPDSGYTETQIIEAWGWEVGRQARVDHYALTDSELSQLTNGLAAGIQSRPPPSDLRRVSPLVKVFLAERRGQALLKTRQNRDAERDALFAALEKNPHVVELSDGLRYEILEPGHGPHPKTGQVVRVDYSARLVDGTVFDRTYNEPLHIEVGSVIAGWNEGIQEIGVGGKIKLYIPPSLGYGNEDVSGVVAPIPANSTLIYDIELLEILDASRAGR
jgi:protein O-mannosyl-transferase